MNRRLARTAAAALIGAVVGVLAMFAIATLLFVLSFTLVAPDSDWSGLFIVSAALLAFGAAFTVTFREMLEKFTR